MSRVVSLRLKDDQSERLSRAARRLGRSPSETAVLLLEEALRQREFAFVEFRDSSVGRQAYLKGSRLAIWQVADIASDFEGDEAAVAAYLEIPAAQVAAALRYVAAYPAEIQAAIDDSRCSREELARMIPGLEVIESDASAS